MSAQSGSNTIAYKEGQPESLSPITCGEGASENQRVLRMALLAVAHRLVMADCTARPTERSPEYLAQPRQGVDGKAKKRKIARQNLSEPF